MAEEKKDAGDEPEKKGGIMKPLILVAAGAVLGGAGVVVAVPKEDPNAHSKEVKDPGSKRLLCPDPFAMTFNPRVNSGKALASLKIKFVYEVKWHSHDEKEQHEQLAEVNGFIKTHWDEADAAIQRILRNTHIDTFQGDEAELLLKEDIKDELMYRLFPVNEADERVAEVVSVMILDFVAN